MVILNTLDKLNTDLIQDDERDADRSYSRDPIVRPGRTQDDNYIYYF